MGLDWEAHDVLADFRECQRASQSTDLVFHCTNGKVSAHQMIFAGISPFFTDLMQRFVVGQELFPLDLNISLPEIRKEHMEMVVEMVYTGQVRITKRDYQPFREICQLLKLSVPIADYDKFFMNQVINEDDSNSFDALDAQDQVPIPLKSPTHPRVFVCDECYAIFPLKIALKKHRKSQHNESELEAPNPPQSPIVSETSMEPQLNTRPNRRQRPLNGIKNLVCLQNEERMVECPDCQSLFRPRQVQQHLAVHLKEELGVLVMRSESVTGIFKCHESLCSYETTVPFYMSRHLGVTHDFIMKFANEAQMKFLHEAQELICKPRSSSLKPCNLSPKSEDMNLNRSRTSQRILENEDGPENENNDIEPEIEIPGEDSNESETQPSNESDELNPTLLTQVNQPSSSSPNGTTPKSSQNEQQSVKCPDCQSLIYPSQVKYHLITHLRAELNEFLKRSESIPEVFECQFCSFETIYPISMKRHLGVIHDMLSKVTNAAQKKFIQDSQELISKPSSSSLKACNSSPENIKKNVNQPRTSQQILENKDCPEVENNDIEPEIESPNEDPTESETEPSNEPDELNLPMVSRLNEPSSSLHNNKISKTSPNDVYKVKCPDCKSLLRPGQARKHMAIHIRKHLNPLVAKRKSVSGLFKCKVCSYETTYETNMSCHLALTHNMIRKLANEAQKKFLQDAWKMALHLRFPSLKGKITKSAQNGERVVKCPDCQSLIHASRATYHLISHLRKELNEFLKRSESKPEVFECQLCSFETRVHFNMRYHLGVTHDTMSKIANAAQKKFLQDAQDMICETRKKILNRRTRNRIQENEDFPEMQNNVEIECNNGLKNAIKSVSTRQDGRALECPDCRKLIHPLNVKYHLTGSHMRENLNKYITKSESVNGLFKCQLCSFETIGLTKIFYHVGAKHTMMKYVNAAQKKFIDDAQRMLFKRKNVRTQINSTCYLPGLSEKLPSTTGPKAFGHPPTQAPHQARDVQ